MGKSNKESIINKKELNVKEEYLKALRTKSYSKAKQQYYSSCDSCCNNLSITLLEPSQDSIAGIVEILSKTPKLKTLMINYFDITAEASTICTQLLKSIGEIEFIEEEGYYCYCSLKNVIVSELSSTSIDEKYSSALHCLNKMRKKVAKKMKVVSYLQNASGICVTAGCGVVAVAVHALVGPALALGLVPFKRLSTTLSMFVKSSAVLRRSRAQLDSAAKGTYILKREFETMSRLVARLRDAIEHNNAMIRSSQSGFCVQLLNELKKSDLGLTTQLVEELQEHLLLCLITINRARALLINQIRST